MTSRGVPPRVFVRVGWLWRSNEGVVAIRPRFERAERSSRGCAGFNRSKVRRRHDMKQLRTALTGLLIGVFAFAAVAVSNPRAVHASTLPSSSLQFYCEYALDWSLGSTVPLDKVYVIGANQNGTMTWHQFPSYYTWDGGHYWWYASNRYISYTATWHTGWLGTSSFQQHSATSDWWVPGGWNGQMLTVFVPMC